MRLVYLTVLYLFWVFLSVFMRIGFLVFNNSKTNQLNVNDIAGIFKHGLVMDVSLAAYIIMPLCIYGIIELWLKPHGNKYIYRIYNAIILFLILALSVADTGLYPLWGFRINTGFLQYLANPKEMLASINHLPVVSIVVVFIVVYTICWWGLIMAERRSFSIIWPKQKFLGLFLLLISAGLLIIPVRGGFQLAPLNQSSVYFSSKMYANHAAINGSWNFLNSIFKKGNYIKNPYQFINDKQADALITPLYNGKNQFEQIVDTTVPPNIILVIWESFTEKATRHEVENKPVTPYFNQLKQEGIYFSNTFSSGNRTNKGVPAVISGFPAYPKFSIIEAANKSQKLSSITAVLKSKGYSSFFVYGGETEFANLKSYLYNCNYDTIYDKHNFKKADLNSKWGAHDKVVLDKTLQLINRYKQPFFTTVLTLSSHEPYETPGFKVFQGNDHTTRFLNSISYTDKCFYEFVNECKKQPWWKNTVMIVTGDHGHVYPETNDKTDEFRIPLLWLGGALSQKGMTINYPVAQTDIAATLLAQLSLWKKQLPFSKNSMDTTLPHWAFGSFDDGFYFVNDSSRFVYDNVSNKVFQSHQPVRSELVLTARAYLQQLYNWLLLN